MLFLLQPLARLGGRLGNGLSPWRRRLRPGAAWPRPRTVQVWSESWHEPQARIQALQDALAARGGFVRSGGPFDRWDLDLRAGPLGGVKIRTAVEEHGSGRQLMRAKIWPRASAAGLIALALLALLSVFALLDGQAGMATTIAVALVFLVALGIEGAGTAMSLAIAELGRIEEEEARSEKEREQAPGIRPGPLIAPGPLPSVGPPLPAKGDAVILRQSAAGPDVREASRWV
jgi:hypothetical protein